jgi:hypothetical protein
MSPAKILVVALLSVYRAKLCGTFASLLIKVITTVEPAGTEIVLMSKAMFLAVSVTGTVFPPEAGAVVVTGTGPVREVTVKFPISPAFGSLRK